MKPKNFLEGELARAMAFLIWRQRRYQFFELGMTKKVVEEHLRIGQHGTEIIDLRECCDYQKTFLKDWPRRVRLLKCVLDKKDKDCVCSDEAASLFGSLVDLLDHQLLRDLLDSDELLVKAGYKAHLEEGEELQDCILYEKIRWNRGKLNLGLRFIAKTVGMSITELIDSLDLFVFKQISRGKRRLRSNAKELARMEKEAFEANASSISRMLLADKPEAKTLQRMEAHTAKQIQNSLQQLSLLRGLETKEKDTPHLAIGIAISNTDPVPALEQPGNTTTIIKEVAALESADNQTFEAASLVDNLSKHPVKALS